MPWLLYRYLVADLLKTIALATIVLVSVIAFGAAIKPLAGGQLAPVDIAKYVALAFVPMLQFALPFAAGFGSTIVLHRMVADNEIVASAAAGISYRRILLPVAVLGAAITLFMLVLLYFIVPRFWVLMKQTITDDVARLVAGAVANREAFVLGDLQIFAEELEIIPNPPGTSVSTRMRLRKVAAADMDETGRIVTDVTAERAVVDLYEIDGQSYLMLTLQNTVAFDQRRNLLSSAPTTELKQPILLPDTFQDQPKFMSLPRILEIRRDPDQFVKVIKARRALALVLQERLIWEEIAARAATGKIELRQGRTDARVVLHADRLHEDVLTRAGAGRVEAVEYEGDIVRRQIACDRAEVSLAVSDQFGARLSIVLHESEETSSTEGDPPIRRAEVPLVDLSLSDLDLAGLFAMRATELLDVAGARTGDRVVARARDYLVQQVADVGYETTARIGQRTALACTGFLLLMLGSVFAMAMRDALPLSIYLLAFLPSVADLLIISGGEQMIRDHQLVGGTAIMWSGNVVLLLLALWAYRRLVRN